MYLDKLFRRYMKIIGIVQAIVSVLLVVSILLQSRGSGLGAGIGVDFGGSYHTKRGFEKFLVRSSVVLSALFIVVSIVAVAIVDV